MLPGKNTYSLKDVSKKMSLKLANSVNRILLSWRCLFVININIFHDLSLAVRGSTLVVINLTSLDVRF